MIPPYQEMVLQAMYKIRLHLLAFLLLMSSVL